MRTKALYWQNDGGTVSVASSILGFYSTFRSGEHYELLAGNYLSVHPTEEAAKAAAQSHFDAAISSVLEDDWQTMETAPLAFRDLRKANYEHLWFRVLDAEARIATARDEGLEMAAKVADGFFEGPGVAAAIRALKGTKP